MFFRLPRPRAEPAALGFRGRKSLRSGAASCGSMPYTPPVSAAGSLESLEAGRSSQYHQLSAKWKVSGLVLPPTFTVAAMSAYASGDDEIVLETPVMAGDQTVSGVLLENAHHPFPGVVDGVVADHGPLDADVSHSGLADDERAALHRDVFGFVPSPPSGRKKGRSVRPPIFTPRSPALRNRQRRMTTSFEPPFICGPVSCEQPGLPWNVQLSIRPRWQPTMSGAWPPQP